MSYISFVADNFWAPWAKTKLYASTKVLMCVMNAGGAQQHGGIYCDISI